MPCLHRIPLVRKPWAQLWEGRPRRDCALRHIDDITTAHSAIAPRRGSYKGGAMLTCRGDASLRCGSGAPAAITHCDIATTIVTSNSAIAPRRGSYKGSAMLTFGGDASPRCGSGALAAIAHCGLSTTSPKQSRQSARGRASHKYRTASAWSRTHPVGGAPHPDYALDQAQSLPQRQPVGASPSLALRINRALTSANSSSSGTSANLAAALFLPAMLAR